MAGPRTAFFERVAETGPGKAETLARLDALATLMDSAFVVPGTRIRLGLDALIGAVPGIGDLVTTIISSYVIWEARRLGLPAWKIARMIGNVALDAGIGLVPFVGDVADVFFKANRRNLRILREHLEQDGVRASARPYRPGFGGRVIEGEYTVAEPRR